MEKIIFCFLLLFITVSAQSQSLFFAGTEFELGEDYNKTISSVDTNFYQVEKYNGNNSGTVFIMDNKGLELGSFAYRKKDNKIFHVAKNWGKYYDLHKAFDTFFFLIKSLPDTANYISADEVVEPQINKKNISFFSGNKSINLVIYPEYIDIYENISD